MDTLPPAINCPPDDTVQLGPDLCSVAYTYMVIAYDDQPGYVLDLIAGLPSGAEFPIGVTTNWWVVTDVGGNNASCSFSVTVRNFPAPLNCRDTLQVYLDASCSAGLPAYTGLEGGPYGCVDSFVVQVDRSLPLGNGPWEPAQFGAADIDRFYGMRITDPFSGNACWGFVAVDDTLPPQLNCQPITLSCIVDVLTPNYLRDSLGIAAGWPAVSDNCYPNVSLSYSDIFQNLPCSDTGTVSGYVYRNWLALDTRGNSIGCTQVITRRRLLSEVRLPADITLGCQDTAALPGLAGRPYITVGNRDFILDEDSFCEIDAQYVDSLEVLCGGSRLLHRRWEVYDACLPISGDNPLIGVQTISLPDTTGPSIDCPDRLIVQSPAFNCSGKVVLPDLVLEDDCSALISYDVRWSALDSMYHLTGSLHNWSGNNPFILDTLGRLDTLHLVEAGVTTLLFSATDLCGSTGLCTTELVLWDQAPPLALCDSLVFANVPLSGTASVPADWLDNGSIDACNPVRFRARRNDSADTLWFPAVDVFCTDVGETVPVTLRVYDVDVPSGPVSDTYAAGQYSNCMTQVFITTDAPPQCVLPPDTLVSCQTFDPTLEAYGTPLLSCSVDSVAVELDISQFDTLCRYGVIDRVVKVFNALGDSSACQQQIVSENVQRYFIRFPDDQDVLACDSNMVYGEPELFDESCGLLYVNYDDELFTMVPDVCYRIERVWTVLNWCTYDANQPLIQVPNPNPSPDPDDPANAIGPVVSAPDATAPWKSTVTKISPDDPAPTDFSNFWMQNANGYTYRQILRITDDMPPAILNCSADPVLLEDTSDNDTLMWFDDYQLTPGVGPSDLCEGPANLSLEVRDLCSGAGGSARFQLFLDLNGDGVQETVIDSENSPPSGAVLVGNAGNPNYSGGTLREFDHRQVAANLKFRFAVRTTSLGAVRTVRLAWNTASHPNGYVIPHLPLGAHRIQWFVSDLCGNETVCAYDFVISNSNIDCLMPVGRVGGTLATENGQAVQYATVHLSGSGPNIPDFDLNLETGSDGFFEFQPVLPVHSEYHLEPERMDLPLNGVSTFDLLLISRHILGIQSLGSPFKLIGADANRSGNVSSFDILELRRLILGIYDELPNNSSWRFVPADFDFPDPENPFLTPFPEAVQVADLQQGDSTTHDFTGIKVGDMNQSVLANGLQSQLDRSDRVVWMDLEDRWLGAGETVRIRLQPDVPLVALQFTLEFSGMEFLALEPDLGMQVSDFSVFPEDHALTAAWFDAAGAAQPVCTLTLRATRKGRLSDMVRLSGRITEAGAFVPFDERALPLRVRFDGVPVAEGSLSAQPNPFTGYTTLSFNHPVDGPLRLEIRDVDGRRVWAWEGWLDAGAHRLPLDLQGIPAAGVLSVHLLSAGQRQSIRLIKI